MYGFLLIAGIAISVLAFIQLGVWGFVPLTVTGFWYMFGGD